ncbi:SufD family Fe-S cluster assembly protein [Anaerolentibacter hominis]|uniref:SufB/SufD family protein n=1 Tax=Anaerolentibacter hominis TaxID=3079009 RepID=UPI0031B803D6
MILDKVTDQILKIIDSLGFKQEGAYNLRYNGEGVCHGDSENIQIKKKEDNPGIDVFISGQTKNEQVHIPVVLSESGMRDIVYNDFYIEAGADVTIVAGCGIHNDGHEESRHDGIHTFHVGPGAVVRYEENHYGEGAGAGGRVLNPVTRIEMEEGSSFTLETSQIKGVDSTVRETDIVMGPDTRLSVIEKLMTHGRQTAVSNMEIQMNGDGSSAQIISRSVAKEDSIQTFHPKAVGNALCHAHVQCDSIIMDHAQVASIPEINAKHVDAQIVHEAAIGRINSEQLTKLRTFGMTQEEAEGVIIEAFLK